MALSLDLGEILSATCRLAVDLLKVDHSGLMVFLSGYEMGYVISEYPFIGTKGLAIPLRGVPAEERMVNFRQPIVLTDISLDSSFSPASDILSQHGIRSVLIVPLISKGRLVGSLGLDMIREVRVFTTDEIRLCEVLAKQAAEVIDLYEQDRRREEQIAALQHAALAVNTKEDLRSVLDTITSQAVQIVGAKDGGISQFNPERGELTVIADYKFQKFLGKTIKMDEGLAGHVIRDDLPFKAVPDYNSWQGQAPVFAKTHRFGAVLMVNLKWQNRTVGVLYINAERGHRFPSELPPMLRLLAGTAAMAIANSRLRREVETARMRVRSTYEASSALASLSDSGQVLQDIANRTLEMAGAEWVRLILIDESGPRSNFIASREGKLLETDNRVQPNGISMRVLSTGEPYHCEDVSKATEVLNPAMIREGSRAALCLPLSRGRRRLGVIWFHYPQPHKFLKGIEEKLAAYLELAVVAYDNAYTMEEQLEPLRRAAVGVEAAVTTDEVLNRIVTSAIEFLHADCAIYFPYPEPDDKSPSKLAVGEAVTAGVPASLLEKVRKVKLPIGETTRSAMSKGWIGIINIDEPTPFALPEESLELLHLLEARSLEGLGLKVRDEDFFGVLYLVYKGRRDFHREEISRARTFAAYAALALREVKRADQVLMAHRAARSVTELMVLGKPEETVKAIVHRTLEVLRCDAVTLFIYDETTDRILPLTTMVGVEHEEIADRCQNAPRDSIVYEMLRPDGPTRNGPYCARDVSKDKWFMTRPFVARERLKSVCAIPLKVSDRRVGVMFVNYRSEHTFPREELEIIELFANQAALAVRNNLLYQEQQKRLDEQKRLVKLSEQLIGAEDEEKMLRLAVSHAAVSLGADFVAVVQPDREGHFTIACADGWGAADIYAYKQGKSDKYQASYTIRHSETVLVTDYAAERRFTVARIIKSKGIRSGLSVPMSAGGETLGAMLAHYVEPSTERELRERERTLSLVTNLTAISIQHHRAVQSKVASLDAVRRASDEISSIRFGTARSEVLDRIVEEAVHCLPQAFIGTILLYGKETNELRFESVYSQVRCDELLKRVGERRPLVRRPELGNKGKIGITGRAVLDKAPQRVNDVSIDPDYYKYSRGTKSELAVPLLTEKNEVLGVLNVESKKLAAFSDDAERALMALAKLVVATIQNAELYALLDNAEQYRLYVETRELVDASTTLAALSMASNDWGHSVAGHALAIRGNLGPLRRKLREGLPEPEARKPLEEKISFIDEIVEQILQKPISALLSLDAPLSDVSINELVDECVEQFRGDPEYRAVRFESRLTRKNPRVRCNPDWIRRMLDILIDNALDAMAGSPAPLLTISTRVVRNQVEIAFTDTGPGIPTEIKHKLFRQRIGKQDGSEGLGIGLLMVQAIARVYRGGARVGPTGPKGTTIYVRLPVIEHS
jgi:GAF domain-containing protein